MAKFENMTLSYTQIASIPFKTRRSASGSLLDALSRDLTPGQRVALFPSYVNQVYASGGVKDGDKVTPPEGGGGSSDVPPTVEKAGPPRPGKGTTPGKKDLDIIPAGLIFGPDGKPQRVPNQQKLAPNASVMTKEEMEAYIVKAAKARGISPEAALKVYRSEGAGGKGPSLQSTVPRQGNGTLNGYEDSHGPFQLFRGSGEGPKGLGNEFEEKTGLKVDDPTTFRQQIDFALDKAADNGWGAWYGSARVGMSPFEGIGEDANPIGISPYNPETPDDITEFSRLENVYDKSEEEITEATAEPIKTSASGADSIVPLGAETDAVINPDKRVVQKQKTEARTRKGEISEELENTLALTSQRTSESTGRNLRFEVTSGGQRMEGAPGWVGTHQHDQGGAADFSIIEVMPDGTERELKFSSPEDRKIINEAAYQFGKSGGKTAGSEYGDMDNKIHFGIPVKDDGLGPRAYEGSDAFKESWQRGHSEYLQWAKENKVDPKTGHTELFKIEQANRLAEYERIAAQTSVEGQSTKVTTQEQPETTAEVAKPNNDVPKIEIPKTATPQPQRISLREGMGGYSAAAGGAEITDPSMIISEDGKKVTRVAETGPEKISVMPRHKSSDVFQENQILMQEARQEQAREEAVKPDIATVKSSQPMSDFGRTKESGQSIAISTVMPKITPSANKAFADAKMVGRFNKAGIDGDMGIVYIDRGYA